MKMHTETSVAIGLVILGSISGARAAPHCNDEPILEIVKSKLSCDENCNVVLKIHTLAELQALSTDEIRSIITRHLQDLAAANPMVHEVLDAMVAQVIPITVEGMEARKTLVTSVSGGTSARNDDTLCQASVAWDHKSFVAATKHLAVVGYLQGKTGNPIGQMMMLPSFIASLDRAIEVQISCVLNKVNYTIRPAQFSDAYDVSIVDQSSIDQRCMENTKAEMQAIMQGGMLQGTPFGMPKR